MSLEYIRNCYGVPAEKGRRIVMNGKPGVITGASGPHVAVLFDDMEPGNSRPCHPTWEMEYLEMGPIRQPTARKRRSKARYELYLSMSDRFDDFRHFLAWHTWQQREVTK